MNSARLESSQRLQAALDYLRSHPGASTLQICQATNDMAVSTTISELRRNGYEIESRCDGETKSGRRVWRYWVREKQELLQF